MKTTINIAFAIVASILLSACKKDFFDMSVTLDIPEHSSKLAAVSLLNSFQDDNTALISFSEGITNSNPEDNHQLVNDATVTLSYDDQNISFSLTDADGIYKADAPITFTVGTTYTLQVSNPDFETITATQIFPEARNMASADIDPKKLHVTFYDPADIDNYYLLMLYKYNTYTGTYESTGIEPFDDTTYRSQLSNGIIFNDKQFNGKKVDILANIWVDSDDENTPQLFKVVLYSTTKDYYRYDRTYSLSLEAENNPFVEPVIIHKNFDKGYGIFALMNKSEISVEMP